MLGLPFDRCGPCTELALGRNAFTCELAHWNQNGCTLGGFLLYFYCRFQRDGATLGHRLGFADPRPLLGAMIVPLTRHSNLELRQHVTGNGSVTCYEISG